MNTIDVKHVVLLLQKKRVQDYSFTVVFFIVFAFFIYFAIRPNLITAFNLQKELQDLRLEEKRSELQIVKIVNYQSTLENYRDELPLLEQAVPASPKLAQVLRDIKQNATDSGVLLQTVNVQNVEYVAKGKQKKMKSFHVIANAETSFENARKFINSIMDQRRLKWMESIEMTNDMFNENNERGITLFRIDLKINCTYL